MKRELSQKVKLSIYWSILVPTLAGHEMWIVTERTRSVIQTAEIGFLLKVVGLSLRNKVRRLTTQRELRVEPLLLHIKSSHLRWFKDLVRMPPGRLFL